MKRHCENPRRKWKVFFLDVSKQFISCLTVHLVNLRISVLFADNTHDACHV